VPGWDGSDVRADRCWYRGPAMKSRDELFWQQQVPDAVPINVGEPMRPPWELEHRWHGAPE
jgi:hypothetical protein